MDALHGWGGDENVSDPDCPSLPAWQVEREEREAEEMRFRKNMEIRMFLDEQKKVRADLMKCWTDFQKRGGLSEVGHPLEEAVSRRVRSNGSRLRSPLLAVDDLLEEGRPSMLQCHRSRIG